MTGFGWRTGRSALPEKLTAEQREAFAKEVDERPGTTVFDAVKCPHCGGVHLRACPRVKRLAFGAGGSIEEVEFWAEGAWSSDGIIYPEDVFGVSPRTDTGEDDAA